MSKLINSIHDLRKPLNAICMQAELIKMLADREQNAEKIDLSANKIIADAKQCSLMLQAFFDYLETSEKGNLNLAKVGDKRENKESP